MVRDTYLPNQSHSFYMIRTVARDDVFKAAYWNQRHLTELYGLGRLCCVIELGGFLV